MKKLLVILLSSSLIFGSTITPAEAGWKAKAAVGVGTALLAGGAILSNKQLNEKSLFSKYNYLIKHPNQANDFFNEYPQDRNTILNILQDKIQELTNLGNKTDLEKAKTLWEYISKTTYVPIYEQTANNSPIIHDNPIQTQNPSDSILDNPIETYQPDNIIYTPQGEPINTIIEYPYETPKNWDEYLILGKDSTELRNNIVADEKRKNSGYIEPSDTEAHHIVSATAPEAADARAILEKYLRAITPANKKTYNNELNGVLLPNRDNKDPTIKGITHNGRHPKTYNQKVNDLIVDADRIGGWVEVQKKLKDIKENLLNTSRTGQWKDF